VRIDEPEGTDPTSGFRKPAGAARPSRPSPLALPASRRGGKLPALKNPEMRPTSRLVAVMFWVGLAGATFVLLILGYGIGLWQFPA
jgi:hypothetical protein